MKNLRSQLVVGLFACLASLAWGQQVTSTPVTTPILTMPVYTLNVAPVRGANRQIVGVTGQTHYFYWAVANYQVGSIVSRLGGVDTANATLSSSNYVLISPYNYPAGVTGVDILRTTTDQAPSGACNCAVTTGATSGTISDQSNSLSSYTVPVFNEQSYAFTLTNEVVGSNSSHWILRQGLPWPGTQVADLSTIGTSGITGSGTTGDLAEFTATGAIGNAPIVDGGATGLTATNPSTGQFEVTSGNSSGAQLLMPGSTNSNAFTYLGNQPYSVWNAFNAGAAGCIMSGPVGGNGQEICAAFDTSGDVGKLTLHGISDISSDPPWELSDGSNGIVEGVPNGSSGSPAGVQLRVSTGKEIAFLVNSTVVAGATSSAFNSVVGYQQNGTPLGIACGTTTTCAATAAPLTHIVYGSAPLVSGTPSTAVVTAISPAFTSITSFVCGLTEGTTAANGVKVVNTSTSSITITGPNTVTDTIYYMCVGT
jgi:hypothetical protein